MPASPNPIDVYLEIGKKRTFASAIDWPGWSRSGRGESEALQALVDAGPRYGRALEGTGIAFHAPSDASELVVVERCEGNATTDFGAPDMPASRDARPMDQAELERSRTLLLACWKELDGAVAAAKGFELRKGPRGGGRESEEIVRHVMGGERGYLGRLARRVEDRDDETLQEGLERTRAAVLDALEAAARGDVPEQGPRGGKIWGARYFVRRLAWHVLDHAWEIEDRKVAGS